MRYTTMLHVTCTNMECEWVQLGWSIDHCMKQIEDLTLIMKLLTPNHRRITEVQIVWKQIMGNAIIVVLHRDEDNSEEPPMKK